MKLVNLKSSEDADCCAPMSMANYGYGLRLHLNDDQCEALGITKAIKPGTQVKISAVAIVVSSSERIEDDGDDKGNDISLDIQITDMGIEAGSVLRDAAKVLYGRSEG